METRKWRRAALAALILSLTACAQQPQTTENGVPIVRDPEHRMSADHWEVVQLPGQATALAAVVDSTRSVLLSVACDKNTALVMGPEKGPHLKNPSLKLVFDGATTSVGLLESFPTDTGWAFGTAAGESSFQTALRLIKEHKTVEATVAAAGAEPLRYRFSLAEAGKTIDHVLAACGKAS